MTIYIEQQGKDFNHQITLEQAIDYYGLKEKHIDVLKTGGIVEVSIKDKTKVLGKLNLVKIGEW